MTNEEKAYVAGFIDGEAYIGLMKRRTPKSNKPFLVKPAIKVAQLASQVAVLEKLQSYYGGYISKTRKHSSSRDSVMWEISSKDSITQLLRDTLPYLVVKKEIAEIVLRYFATPKLTNADNEENRKVYQERCRLQEQCAKLTRRGLAETE